MSGFFALGETKERPGVYKRYENQGTEYAGALEKVAACVVASDWGAVNKPVRIDNTANLEAVAGSAAGLIEQIFYDGPSEVIMVRAGSGGSKGTLGVKGAQGNVERLTLELKYPTGKNFTLTRKARGFNDSNPDLKGTYILKMDGVVVEEWPVYLSEGAWEANVIAEKLKSSKYVNVVNVVTSRVPGADSALGELESFTDRPFTDTAAPTVDANAYAEALGALETETWHYLCTDTNDTSIHAIIAAYIARIHKDGAYGRCVLSEPGSVAINTRFTHAKAYNDEKVIYLLNGWKDASGNVVEGYMAAARLCGMLAATPSNECLTRAVIRGATALSENLTNAQIKQGLRSGCLMLTMSKNRQVVVEEAINTLVTPATNQDSGWKKIKRVDIRFELMDRIERVTDPMVGQVNNDTNGRAAVIAAAQRVIDAMIGEGKLLGGNCLLDTSQQPAGDSAWFKVTADDIDALEKIYLTFGFRFSQNS